MNVRREEASDFVCSAALVAPIKIGGMGQSTPGILAAGSW